MAWKARVLGIVQTDDSINVRVAYFDDADADVILHRSLLRLPAGTTRIQGRAAIIAEGQRLRDAATTRVDLSQDVGAVITVT